MGIDITSIGWMDIASPNTLLIAVNIILILLAFFLLVRFRLSRMKRKAEVEPVLNQNNEQKNELFGIDIKPDEFKSDRLEMKTDFLAPLKPPEATPNTVSELADLTKSESLTPSIKQEVVTTHEPIAAQEQIAVPEPMTAQEPNGSAPYNNVSVSQPENMEAPGAEALGIDENELEDELDFESPEEFASSPESEIQYSETEEEMLEEEIDFSLEPEVTPQEKKEETPPVPTLPLELHLTPPEKEEENTSERTILPLGLDMMVKKDEVKPAEVLSIAPESSISQPQSEVKATDTIDVKPAEVLSIAPEPTIEQPEPEIKLFNFDARIDAKPETVTSTPEKGLSPTENDGENVAEDAPEPEIKLFNFDARIDAKPETVTSTPEKGLSPTEKEGEKAAEDAPEPEIKLFNFEAGMEAKSKPVAASSEIVTPEKTVVPAAGVASGDIPNQDGKVKKAKRKSLF